MKKYKIIYTDPETGAMEKLIVTEKEKQYIDSQRTAEAKATSPIFLNGKIEVQKRDIRKVEEILPKDDPVNWKKKEKKDDRVVFERLSSWMAGKEVYPFPKCLHLLDTYGEDVIEHAGRIITEKNAFNCGFRELDKVCERIKHQHEPSTKNFTKQWLQSEVSRLEQKFSICGMRDLRIAKYKAMIEKDEKFTWNDDGFELWKFRKKHA